MSVATATLTLPPLPYALDALEPHMSRETLQFHHGRHHRAYVDTVNRLVAGGEHEGATLEEILASASGALFDNAAQVWNHGFFWNCLAPRPSRPSAGLLARLEAGFGGFEAFRSRFTRAATSVFGSGWAWLAEDFDGTLRIVATRNAGMPGTSNQVPLLTCDVWEHAYYLDWRNERARYLEHFWPLVNWEFVERNLERGWEWSSEGEGPDPADKAAIDSFPASDPPASSPTRVGPPRRGRQAR